MSQTENKKNDLSAQIQGMEELEIGSAVYTTRLTAKFRGREKWERPDEKKLKSIIPGTIQKIFVQEGDQVVAGEALLILEAMKMRNEVLSPISGIIKKINVSEGEQVSKEYLLVVFN